MQRLNSQGHKSGLVVSELDSQSKGCGFESRLIQILVGNGQDRFLHPILVHSWKNKKIQVAKWGKPTKKIKMQRLNSQGLGWKVDTLKFIF